MDPAKRNAAALHQRIDDVCDNITNHFVTAIAAASGPPDSNNSAAAHTELTIKEESTALVRSAQDLSTLVREMQELWLNGRLDTLVDPGDEQASKDKALGVAAMIETIAKKHVARSEENKDNGQSPGEEKDEGKSPIGENNGGERP